MLSAFHSPCLAAVRCGRRWPRFWKSQNCTLSFESIFGICTVCDMKSTHQQIPINNHGKQEIAHLTWLLSWFSSIRDYDYCTKTLSLSSWNKTFFWGSCSMLQLIWRLCLALRQWAQQKKTFIQWLPICSCAPYLSPFCWGRYTFDVWHFRENEKKRKEAREMTLVSCCRPTGDRACLLFCTNVTECVAPVALLWLFMAVLRPRVQQAATNLTGWQADRRLAWPICTAGCERVQAN